MANISSITRGGYDTRAQILILYRFSFFFDHVNVAIVSAMTANRELGLRGLRRNYDRRLEKHLTANAFVDCSREWKFKKTFKTNGAQMSRA